MELTFYTTAGCHLCDQALALIEQQPALAGHWLTLVDVADSEALLARHGERIPVLAGAGRELAWPFDAGQLADFAAALTPAG